MDLYDVYARQTAQGQECWGVQSTGDSRLAYRTMGGSVLERRSITLSNLGSSIAQWLRKGFRGVGNGYFFDEDAATFGTEHPDFRGIQSYVLFCKPPDIAQAVIDIEPVALQAFTGSSIDQSAVRQWLSEQEQNSEFMIAPVTHPMYALLLAETAINHGWPLFTANPNPPNQPPSSARMEWVGFLSTSFAEQQVFAALSALGFSVAQKLMFASVEVDSTEASNFL
jgi:hypothetical protein